MTVHVPLERLGCQKYIARNQNNLLMRKQPRYRLWYGVGQRLRTALKVIHRSSIFDIISKCNISNSILSIDIKISNLKIKNKIHNWHHCVKSRAKLFVNIVFCCAACASLSLFRVFTMSDLFVAVFF